MRHGQGKPRRRKDFSATWNATPSRRLRPCSAKVDEEVDALTALRNRRLRAAQSGVPEELWLGTIVLSWILIAITSFVHPERRDMHLALVACTALAMGLLLWVAIMIDFPYCGGSSVTPVPLQHSINWMLGNW